MSTLIAGLFGTLADAEAAVARLEHAGVAPAHLSTFRSLVGAPQGTGDGPKREDEYLRTAGTMIAVNASLSDVASETIARILKQNNAVEVEDAEGAWANGTWVDFDPLRPPHRVDEPPPIPSAKASAPPAS